MSIEHKDIADIKNGYFDRANPVILKKIPLTAKKILEVGCGAGALAGKYKESNPDCEYYGIELSAKAAEYAVSAGRVDRIKVGEVESINLDSLDIKDGSLDCIIYGDVLEHLQDPWGVIKEHKTYLGPDGIMIASIPNVGNFTIIYQLLRGQWNYQDEGVLDRTHLRFFTGAGIKKLFLDAGLVIKEMEGRCYFLKKHTAFMQAIAPILPDLGLDINMVNRNTKALQYIVVAKNRQS